MRVAVTGGGGFLGSHLCDALLRRGDEVVCLDDFSTGDPANIAPFLGDPAFELVRGDVSVSVDVPGTVDAVAHLASPASPPDYLARPLATLAVGSRGTENALRLAAHHDARFVLASTSEVYGDPVVHPQRRDVLGQRESRRAAQRLRRGEALRRGADPGLPDEPWSEHRNHRGSSTPMVRACVRTTVESSPVSSSRHSPGSH